MWPFLQEIRFQDIQLAPKISFGRGFIRTVKALLGGGDVDVDLESLPVAFRREGQHRKNSERRRWRLEKRAEIPLTEKAGSILIGPEPNSVGTPGLKHVKTRREQRFGRDSFIGFPKYFRKRWPSSWNRSFQKK